MSVSRLSFLRGTSPAMTMMLLPFPNHSLSSLSLLRFSAKPSFSETLHACSYTSPAIAAAAAETSFESPTTTAAAPPHHHPWPEWVDFVDRLKSQGYFPQNSAPSNGELVYREMNVLKDPCLSFARDRYDVFQSLSKGDIQAIVEGGCPKILRKVINSAKRLRVYVGLDERNVCSGCSLQGSCDRAFVTLKESEQDARTVDVVRLLLFYALDPLAMSGDVGSQSVGQAISSARRLLRMLTDLSEARPSLAPVEPSSKDSHQKKQTVPSKNAVVPQNIKTKKGDWICPECSFMNFWRNVQCRKCNAEGPKGSHESANPIVMKIGDWNCPQCGCMNFSRRCNCFRCKESRPPRNLSPGEWECPKCNYLNFRRNVACLKCNTERVKEAVSQYEEQFWRRPQ